MCSLRKFSDDFCTQVKPVLHFYKETYFATVSPFHSLRKRQQTLLLKNKNFIFTFVIQKQILNVSELLCNILPDYHIFSLLKMEWVALNLDRQMAIQRLNPVSQLREIFSEFNYYQFWIHFGICLAEGHKWNVAKWDDIFGGTNGKRQKLTLQNRLPSLHNPYQSDAQIIQYFCKRKNTKYYVF